MTDLQNWAPYEVLVGPADVYVAVFDTTFPVVNVTPNGSWTYIGRTEGGVTVRHAQTVNPISADQYTGPIKAVRTDEGCEVEFSLVNLTLENYSLALNNIGVTSAAGPPATKTISLHRGLHVDLRAIVVRGRSAYGNFPAQYQIPCTYQSETSEVSHVKDDKSVLHCIWTAIEDAAASTDADRFGQLVHQTA